MIIQDDRTELQKSIPHYIVVGTDTFLSGCGEGMRSYAGWAVRWADLRECEEWVESRSDMKRVRVVDGQTYRPTRRGHLHIYVFESRK